MTAAALDLDAAARAGARPPAGAISVLWRGARTTPELADGILVTLLLAVVAGGGRVVVPVLVQVALDHGVRAGGGAGDYRVLIPLLLAGVVALSITALAARATQRRLIVNVERALCHLRTEAFAHVHRLALADLAEEQRGQLVSRVTSDVDTVSELLQWGGIAWVVNTTLMLVVIVAMAVYDWRLALAAVSTLVPLVIGLRRIQRRLVAAYDRLRSRVGDLLAAASESLMGAAVIRGYGAESTWNHRLELAVVARREADRQGSTIGALLYPLGDAFSVVSVSAVLIVGVALGPRGGLSEGTLVACAFLVVLLLQPVAEFTEILDQTQMAVAGWRRVLDLIDAPVSVTEPLPAEAVVVPDGPPAVEVDGVSYTYPSGGEVLHDVSFTVRPGSRVALVGATGSGKSTLAKLLVRFADPTAGVVRVGGVDLRNVSSASLRQAVMVVPQEVFLFDTSIGENVRFARPDASDEDVVAAFSNLGLADWVDGLPLGLATPVGERGEQISAGERQLVALARAQLADPRCLVLDEATSAVDPATEVRVGRALERLANGRTSITVAHRLSTAARSDVVLVLDGGRLVEQGAHEELVAAGGVYAHLYRRWLQATAA